MLSGGTVLRGKWTGKECVVHSLIGKGANGEVYLVTTASGQAALKTCASSADVALEWGVLEQLQAVSDVFPRPLYIDDQITPRVFYYVMEWIAGEPLSKAAKHLQHHELKHILRGMFRSLEKLHKLGYAFCDVKPDNILISKTAGLSLRFVDVGGVTQIGRSVRQFTPFYDRAFWGLGTRVAEPSYDVCAAALAAVCLFCPPGNELVTKPESTRIAWLHRAIKSFPCPEYIPVLEAAIGGTYREAGEVLQALANADMALHSHRRAKRGTRSPRLGRNHQQHQAGRGKSSASHRPSAVRVRRNLRGADWTEWVMWGSLSLAAASAFMAWGSFLGWFAVP